MSRSSKVMVVLLAACGLLVGKSSADEHGGSRIRVFGQNGAGVDLHPGSACLDRQSRERVSGSMGSAFGSMLGKVSNESLGIPETPTTRNIRQMDGILSKAYFREYVIPSGVPTSLRLSFKDVSSFYSQGGVTYSRVSPACSGAVSFVPESGQDYEVAFYWQGKACHVSVNQIVAEGDETKLLPVQITPAPKC